MPDQANSLLIDDIRSLLAAAADPSKAPGMQAYMKSEMASRAAIAQAD